ncbi:hypothetical protein RUM43_000296 [Polyplax serrata]|uniref:Metaxin n=1 Tax=Polyplax serrata TaxID=468196 RepID=A0AAN8SDU1_POLSC
MTNRSMELEVWSGDWGLPSIDINCLQILVYCKLSGAPVQLIVKNNPFRGTLPTFRHGQVTLYTLQEVMSYLKGKNFYGDHMLTTKNISEIQAYAELLKEKLYPAFQFVWWVDNKNSVGLTRSWFAKKLMFPLNFYYPGHYEGEAKNLIAALYGPLEEDLPAIETQVYSDAEKCLTLLSNRLGESKYFFGNQASSLDAIIYSYLAPLLRAPFPNPTLQNHLKACNNLVSFVIRITQKYFPAISEEYEKKQKEEAQKKQLEEEFPHKRRNQFFASLIAAFAMVMYAISSGLVQSSIPIELSIEDDDDDIDED